MFCCEKEEIYIAISNSNHLGVFYPDLPIIFEHVKLENSLKALFFCVCKF